MKTQQPLAARPGTLRSGSQFRGGRDDIAPFRFSKSPRGLRENAVRNTFLGQRGKKDMGSVDECAAPRLESF